MRLGPGQLRRYDFIVHGAEALGRDRPRWSEILEHGMTHAETEIRSALAGAGIDASEIMQRAMEARELKNAGKGKSSRGRPSVSFDWSRVGAPIVDE